MRVDCSEKAVRLLFDFGSGMSLNLLLKLSHAIGQTPSELLQCLHFPTTFKYRNGKRENLKGRDNKISNYKVSFLKISIFLYVLSTYKHIQYACNTHKCILICYIDPYYCCKPKKLDTA